MKNAYNAKYLAMRYLGVPKMPLYIHIPKTGGTYLKQAQTDKIPVIYPVKTAGHKYVIDNAKDLNVIYLQHDIEMAKRAVVPRKKLAKYFVFL